jgi:SpoVK/Ycf46/Vps4 family AAA+-type ATPase
MSETSHSPEEKPYKFRELKVYSSTEWLADNKKKYRQVFDRHETAFVYAELSFFNKMFDKDDWEIDLELRCYSLKKTKAEICILPMKRKVSKYDNVVYIREGWGNKNEGAFWKKGTYYWEAWLDGEKVASKYFYIEDAGIPIKKFENPYMSLQTIKLYEGPYDDQIEEERIYYKKFSTEETRYIYVEMVFKNLNINRNWQCELFIKFYNDARELKGQVIRLNRVDRKNETFTLTAGWGSNSKGSWRPDLYSVEIVFFDHLIAVVPFEIGEGFVEGVPAVYLPNKGTSMVLSSDMEDNRSFEELMVELEALIGLDAIKKQVWDHASYIQFLQLRKTKGFDEPEEINVHSIFVGNPGTGKTTVAKMMGRLYQRMGLLSKGHVHEVDRVDLVGEYIGQTAPKVKEAIEKARGGVLFIDEAYALARAQDDHKDFGREAIEILVKELSNGKGDLAVIVAGYPKEMKQFLESNPGLKSRFKHTFEFSDYLPQELSRIADYACKKMEVKLSNDARIKIDEYIIEAFRNRDRSFGNARFVFDLIEKGKIFMGLRIMEQEDPESLEKSDLEVINLDDVLKIDVQAKRPLPEIPVDEGLLEESLKDLDGLIGMDQIKSQIHELVRLVRYYRETGRDVLRNFSFHTVFVGNPGTGKTTVARILTRIYKSLGILERGQMVETDRQGLVAGFVGQTAIKTAEKIEEALGGVLFIDEAYALTTRQGSAHGDFGYEAIQTLLKRMEDKRGEFFVFVAGYPENMEAFLKANPGLNSRFDKVLKFEDYQPEELMRIGLKMLDERGLIPSPEAEEHLREYFKFIHEYRDPFFGNARTVRTIVDEAAKNQNLRLATLDKKDRVDTSTALLTLDDVASFSKNKDEGIFVKKRIGFNAKKQQDN